jgi:hypothetical protein
MMSWIPLSSEQVGDAKLPAGLVTRDLLSRLRSTLETAKSDVVVADDPEQADARSRVLQHRIDEITAALKRASARERLRLLLPDKVDAHLYGGGLLVAIGVGMYSVGAGLIALGALLVYLGWRAS